MKLKSLPFLALLCFSCAPATQQSFALGFVGNPPLKYDVPLQVSQDGKKLAAASGGCVEIIQLDNHKITYRNCNLRGVTFNADLSKIYASGKIIDVALNQEVGTYPNSVWIQDDLLVSYMTLDVTGPKNHAEPIKFVKSPQENLLYAQTAYYNNEYTYVLDATAEPTVKSFQKGYFLDALGDRYAIATQDGKLLVFNSNDQIIYNYSISTGDSIAWASASVEQATRIGLFMRFISDHEVLYINRGNGTPDNLVVFNLDTQETKMTRLPKDVEGVLDYQLDYTKVVVSPEARTVFFQDSLSVKF